MALNQRRVKILHLIREDGHAKVQDLSKIFNVTDVTIRQDLEALEQMGYIQREHGGAFLKGVGSFAKTGTSSQPGAKTTLRVRGIASMNASTEPLYVLDGVPIPSYDLSNFTSMSEAGGMGVIETLNPADIESITVLKDAASASLYGAEGRDDARQH